MNFFGKELQNKKEKRYGHLHYHFLNRLELLEKYFISVFDFKL